MANLRPVPAAREFDLNRDTLRDLNLFLHKHAAEGGVSQIRVQNPNGAHSIACGLNADLEVHIHGHVGYYVAGMNKHASVTIYGNAGPGAGENMMSGRVHIKGFASTAAGASAHGGLLIIDGDASVSDAAPPQPIPMVVNRPYLIAIIDTPTGTILSLGHLGDPTDVGTP